MKLKHVFKSWRIWVLIIFLVFAVVAISPRPGIDGVVITSVAKDSAAFIAGMQGPTPKDNPMSRERILEVNSQPVNTPVDYYSLAMSFPQNTTVTIKTSRTFYRLYTKPLLNITILNETTVQTVEETIEVNETVNGTTQLVNKTVMKMIEVPKKLVEVIGTEDLGIKVDSAPSTNLRKGLDLQGGTRVVLAPEEEITSDAASLIIESLKQRLNVYGLSDIVVTEVKDSPGFLGGGKSYILVEIAGATEEEVKTLIGSQGKFEAKIGDETVFRGGNDITYVCRTAECSGIDPNRGCGKSAEGYGCSFLFTIALSPDAAQRQAEITGKLSINESGGVGERYLSKDLTLYLDDEEVDSLRIAADLKGRAVTEIAITGGGSGTTEQAAVQNALQNMKKLQTVLITGSLPVKLNVIKIDTISPVLGPAFIKNAWFMGMLAAIAVTVVLIIAYRKISLVIPILITLFSEVLMILGIAALIRWNLDLAAIAGIIVAVGTGVDDQIVIIDETLRGGGSAHASSYQWKDKLKKAFFIIFAAYAATVVAMVPLLFAGAGLLKGFALTTILGVTVGVFITRPAFAAILDMLVNKDE